jgi:hypothetical protein
LKYGGLEKGDVLNVCCFQVVDVVTVVNDRVASKVDVDRSARIVATFTDVSIV